MILYFQSLLQHAFLLVSTHFLADQARHDTLGSRNRILEVYDYIVVGAGAAGATAAARLSENPNLTVLLLEIGKPADATSDIPAMDVVGLLNSAGDNLFSFIVEPQTHAAFGFPDKKFQIIGGRVMGGGTTVNGMAYNRGGALDYDGWEKHYGLKGWSYSDVLPFFKKSENQLNPEFAKTKFHGVGGPISVKSRVKDEQSPNYSRMSQMVEDAALEFGLNRTDFNGANQVGVTQFQRACGRDGKRVSTATAFLEPAIKEGRKNLHILSGAEVTRILFEGKRATRVQFLWKGEAKTVRVNLINKGEVTLSAGTVNSAKILMLSGIGPKKDLESLSIPLVADLPVGQNFQDRPRIGGADFVCEQPFFDFWQDLLTVENLHQFYENGTGPLANNFYAHQDSTINYKSSVSTRGVLFGPADYFIAPGIIPPPLYFLANGEPDLKEEIFKKYLGPYAEKPTINFFTALNYVQSRGYVKLRSTDPRDLPLVNPRYLTNQDDVDRLVEAYKFTMKLGETTAFKNMGCRPFEFPLPGCESLFNTEQGTGNGVNASDEYIECKVRHLTNTELHPVGSCPMAGDGAAPGFAVLDPELRVRGEIKGLRVVDASAMPLIVTGNTMATSIMIGERGADFILNGRAKNVKN